MTAPKPSPSRRAAAKDERRRGMTVPVQGERQERAPRLPHERDESADSQSTGTAAPPRIGELAHDDLERGLVDTDKGPVLDQAYEKMRKGDEPTKTISPQGRRASRR
jgi:hypothetical protein